ncbi:MAG: cell division protein FtsI, partial [Phenylobacterium sp.]
MSRSDTPKPKRANRRVPKPAPPQGHSARRRRVRVSSDDGGGTGGFAFRRRTGNIAIGVLIAVAAAQLFNLQVPKAAGLRAEAAGQLKVTDVEQALRGAIVDRNFDKLAFTIEARALTFQPVRIREQLAEAREKSPDAPDPALRLRDIAKDVSTRLNNRPDMATVLRKLQSNDSFVYLARAVDPAVATAIMDKFPEVGSERQDLRQYPGGALAANMVGGIDWDGHG